jgi:GYF domain 2
MDGWFYEANGERRGPLTLEQMKTLVNAGAIRRDTRVWRPGAAETDLTRAGDFLGELASTGVNGGYDPALKHVLPVGRSGLAIAAGYLGLFSFIPLVGFVGLAISILAARDLKRHPEKLGWGRVITGLVLSSLFSLLHVVSIYALFTGPGRH